ncbi:hypothetical protein M0R88_05845 [Halorussus gelatinilyticus]|uniref:Uncharacterized protein n=1 Tax=Halorussus gelatinilyticus TaxID=2937524 RepID=A0A8U0IMH1_9EURY|nr:hypothetical protein [Halorussus gelatinilyticus]UPW01622.1 hypothetical protein M0R88_05845 [Halorussus gelatinilyticus]
MRRRTALKSLASASVGLSVAGCLGAEEEPGTATSRTSATTRTTDAPVTETGEPTTTESSVGTTTDTTTDAPEETRTTTHECPAKGQPAPPCGGDWKRLNAATSGDVSRGTAGGFELTAEPTTLSLGDCVTFRLTNRSGEKRTTGIRECYDIHRKTDGGWQSVLFTKRRGYIDLGIWQEPGEGFVWKRRLSQAGLSGHSERHEVRACEPLEPGTYRFVYWGGAGHFDSIAAEFEVTE